MPEITLAGVPVYYETRGRRNSPAIVLLHGLGSSSADWGFQLPALEAGYRVLAPDLRGHGRSSRPRGPLTIAAMARDVAALLDALEIPSAHVAGLSLGGCVGLALALDDPARVRSLTLVNAFAHLAPAGPRGALRMLVRLGYLGFAPMPVAAAYVARRLFPRPEQHDLYLAAVTSLAATPRRTYFASIRALLGFDVRSRLAAIRCPTLVIAGDRDLTVPRSAGALLQRSILGARILVIGDSGHATPYDQVDDFNAALLAFLAAQ